MDYYCYVGKSDRLFNPLNMDKQAIPYTQEAIDQAISEGYKYISAFTFEYIPTDDRPYPIMRGPLIIEFNYNEVFGSYIQNNKHLLLNKKFYSSNYKDKISIAIRNNIENLVYAYQIDVNNIRIWINGTRSIQLEIPSKLFGAEGGYICLHEVYMGMLDFLIYMRNTFDDKDSIIHYPCMTLVDTLKIEHNTLTNRNTNDHIGTTYDLFMNLTNEELTRLPYDKNLHDWFISATSNLLNNLDLGHYQISEKLSRSYEAALSSFSHSYMKHMYVQKNYIFKFLKECPFIRDLFDNKKLDEKLDQATRHSFYRAIRMYYSHKLMFRAMIKCSYINGRLCYKCNNACGFEYINSPVDLFILAPSRVKNLKDKLELLDNGVYYWRSNYVNEWICSYLKIHCEMHTINNEDWSILFLLKIKDRTFNEVISRKSDIYKRCDETIDLLVSNGLMINLHLKDSRKLIKRYIQSGIDNLPQGLIIEKIGWISDTSYILNETLFGSQDYKKIYNRCKGANKYNIKGSLSDWQTHVCKYCEGNSILTFSVCFAFTGVLLNLFKYQGNGFHLYGESSLGKTTVAYVAGSVCGGGDERGFLFQWETTDNGLERLALNHNDNFLVIDDNGQADPKVIYKSAFMLANGQGKIRYTEKNAATWTVNFLSTGELSMNDKIESDTSLKVLPGQRVRVIDLPIDEGARVNAFQNLHGIRSSKEFSNLLSSNAKVYYGAPIVEFLSKLCSNIEEYKSILKGYIDQFINLFDCDNQLFTNQELRVLDKFALTSAAGQLAIKFGILTFTHESVIEAAKHWFDIWLRERNKKDTRIRSIIDLAILRFKDYIRIMKMQAISLDTINEVIDDSNRDQYPILTWTESNETFYMISPNIKNHILKEYTFNDVDDKLVKRELHMRGYLATTSNGNIRETKSINNKNIRGWIFKGSAIFDDSLPNIYV